MKCVKLIGFLIGLLILKALSERKSEMWRGHLTEN